MNGTCWSSPELEDELLPKEVSKHHHHHHHHHHKHHKHHHHDDVEGPKGRWKAEAVVHPNGRDLVLFGGCTGSAATKSRNDLWVFRAAREDPLSDPTVEGSWRQVDTANP